MRLNIPGNNIKYLKENFTIFHNQLYTATQKLINGLEWIKTNINRHSMSKLVNQTCLNENTLVNYTRAHTNKLFGYTISSIYSHVRCV